MDVDVVDMRDVVTIDVQVTPLGGDHECQLVPTPSVVELREPLGDRVLVDANARTPRPAGEVPVVVLCLRAVYDSCRRPPLPSPCPRPW